jgi:hypothetical protein
MTYVVEGQEPPPQRPPDEIALLDRTHVQMISRKKTEAGTYLMAAVSSVTPSLRTMSAKR